MIQNFRSKALKRYFEKADRSGIRPDRLPRVSLILFTLYGAGEPDEMNLPGFGFHPLTGDRAGRFAVTVSRNWRITFGWTGDDATDVDLEDYHGR